MGWIAKLKNGEIVHEDENEIAGEVSPYQRLLEDMKAKNTGIQSLDIELGGITFHGPSEGGEFPSIPCDISHRKRMTQNLKKDGSGFKLEDAEYFTGYTMIVKGLKISLWINTETGDNYLQIEDAVV